MVLCNPLHKLFGPPGQQNGHPLKKKIITNIFPLNKFVLNFPWQNLNSAFIFQNKQKAIQINGN
jgi:hypothetical protein